MKSALLPALLGAVCFVASLVGTTFVLPGEEPEVVADSLATPPAVPATDRAVEDSSLATADGPVDLERDLEAAMRDVEALREQIRTAEATEHDQQTASQQAEAQALSGTLSKLEPAELSSILARLDLEVVGMIYSAASSRNRTRLLQALPAERAARLVQHLTTGPAPAPVGDPAPADAPTPQS